MTKPSQLSSALARIRDVQGLCRVARRLGLAARKEQAGTREPVRTCMAKQLELGALLLDEKQDEPEEDTFDSDLQKFVSKALDVKSAELRGHLLFSAYLRRVQEQDQEGQGDGEPGAKNWILDVGGTVCDRGCRAPMIAMQRVFLDHGLKLEASQIAQDMDLGKREHVLLLLERHASDLLPRLPRFSRRSRRSS